MSSTLRFTLRQLFFAVTVLCLMLGAMYALNAIYHDIRTGIGDHYAVSEVNEIIGYYVSQGGSLPHSWEDLADAYKFVDQGYSLGPNGLQVLRERVWVNFPLLFDVERMRALFKASNKVMFIRLRHKRDADDLLPCEIAANDRIEQIARRAVAKSPWTAPTYFGTCISASRQCALWRVSC